MHEIVTAIVIADKTELVEVCEFGFESQEEVLDFLNDYALMELDRLYGLLKTMGDRTTAFVEPAHRKALTRKVSGTSRKDGRAPIDGSITITARRVA